MRKATSWVTLHCETIGIKVDDESAPHVSRPTPPRPFARNNRKWYNIFDDSVTIEAVTKDQLNTGLPGQIRYRIAEIKW